MTKEELDVFEKKLEENGYVKYTRNTSYEHYKYYWYKAVRKYNDSDDIPDCIISYKVYDYSEYVYRDQCIKVSPYYIEIDLYLDGIMKSCCDYFRPTISTDMPINRVEEMADSLIEWGRNFGTK